MKLFTRTLVDPAEAQARIEHARLVAAFEREQRQAAEAERERQQAKREAAKVARREQRKATWSQVRTVLPLLLINGGAAYSQAGYAYQQVAPPGWNVASKLAFAVAFATALESISIYVQWHAHDALMLKAHATAAKLRRAAWYIAAVIAAINYAHWAGDRLAPTSAAIAFGLLSLLSPWLWGLHTRRAQHVQLLAEDADAIDSAGVEFSPERRRAFPIRSHMAKRWSIDHGVRNPQQAWDGYKAERQRRREERRQARVEQLVTAPATQPDMNAASEGNATADMKSAKARSRTRPAAATGTAVKVAKVAAKLPDATAATVAAKVGISERSARRHLAVFRADSQPAIDAVNGSVAASTT